MDEEILGLFQEWLCAFRDAQDASSANPHTTLAEIEERIAAAPAEGLKGLVVKLALHCFLSEHSDPASIQSESAYRDLVRLTGQDPIKEIAALKLPYARFSGPR